MTVGVTPRRDREELEGPRHRVVQRGEPIEGRGALGLGHELEVEGGELEAPDRTPVDDEAAVADRRGRPGIHRARPTDRVLRWSGGRAAAQERDHAHGEAEPAGLGVVDGATVGAGVAAGVASAAGGAVVGLRAT